MDTALARGARFRAFPNYTIRREDGRCVQPIYRVTATRIFPNSVVVYYRPDDGGRGARWNATLDWLTQNGLEIIPSSSHRPVIVDARAATVPAEKAIRHILPLDGDGRPRDAALCDQMARRGWLTNPGHCGRGDCAKCKHRAAELALRPPPEYPAGARVVHPRSGWAGTVADALPDGRLRVRWDTRLMTAVHPVHIERIRA